jgi:hypothetical protein
VNDNVLYQIDGGAVTIDWSEILTGVILAAIVGAGGTLWVVFTEAGRRFWATLGTFELKEPGRLESPTRILKVNGVRFVAVVALTAFLIALGSLIALATRPTTPASKFVLQRFGAKGPAGRLPGDEEDYVAMDGGKTPLDALVASRNDYPICTVTSIHTWSGPGDCALLQSSSDDWRMHVAGLIKCRVTCFRIEPGK